MVAAVSAGIPGDTDDDRCVSETELADAIIPFMEATFLGEATPHLDKDDLQSAASACLRNTWFVTDDLGRRVEVPTSPEHVICSNAGALRYLTYLQAEDLIVGVDSIEAQVQQYDTRPYAIANPQFKNYPVFGEYLGRDDPEKIVALDPQPQVIFKTYVYQAAEADALQEKTGGIPVVCLNYGDLGVYRSDVDRDLRLMGSIVGKEERAEGVIEFFDSTIADLNSRTEGVPDSEKKSVYVGGIAYYGPQGLQSTEPAYPPFMFVNAKNVAAELGTDHAEVAKEKIVDWDPEVIFVDLGTLGSPPETSALNQLKNDPAYANLSARNSGEIYGLVSYNYYTTNLGSVIADGYYIGKVLYPDRFSDIDPVQKADEIYTFLVDDAVFDTLNNAFYGKGFTKLTL
ncbi:MAG: iron ABC transporter substrate-binding protein [Methanofollis sp.]|uniref:iron ABC transporter substrate-binding protein n=1 Tax=Methanofollis sp. TaxID=2052835 RepID=UPI00262FD2BC|nr:iron ABC transporter substrate-binding protein [Methanofollis sp.]MDD4254850.1 iron ABC transporter substrate-binding protein [Methanofollis sp.]